LYELPNDTQQKNGDRQRIDRMHNAKVNVGWPVRIFLSEEVHKANIK